MTRPRYVCRRGEARFRGELAGRSCHWARCSRAASRLRLCRSLGSRAQAPRSTRVAFARGSTWRVLHGRLHRGTKLLFWRLVIFPGAQQRRLPEHDSSSGLPACSTNDAALRTATSAARSRPASCRAWTAQAGLGGRKPVEEEAPWQATCSPGRCDGGRADCRITGSGRPAPRATSSYAGHRRCPAGASLIQRQAFAAPAAPRAARGAPCWLLLR